MDLKYLKHLARKGSTFIHPKGFEATELLISNLNINTSDSILEIGCGTGGTLIEIISRFGINITAVEILDEMIMAAKKNLSSLNLADKVKIVKINPGEKYPFEYNSFDKIYAESVIGFQDKPSMEFIFSEIKRILKPHGIFVLNDSLWKPGVPDSIVDKITRQSHKDFGLAHASPYNIDLEGLINIARNSGLKETETLNLDSALNTPYGTIKESKVMKIKSVNKFSLVNTANSLRYNLKLKKQSDSGKYIASYLISFTAI